MRLKRISNQRQSQKLLADTEKVKFFTATVMQGANVILQSEDYAYMLTFTEKETETFRNALNIQHKRKQN